MSFIWNYWKNPTIQDDFFIYQESKKKYVLSLANKIREGNLEQVKEYFKEKDILTDVINQLKEEKTEYFTNQEKSWRDVFNYHETDHAFVLFLLCHFSEKILHLNWRKDWNDFVSGRNICHPYSLYMEKIKQLFDSKKYDALEKRFDFNHYWESPISFVNFIKNICSNQEQKVITLNITPNELESCRDNLKKTEKKEYKKEKPIQNEILHEKINNMKTKLRSKKDPL